MAADLIERLEALWKRREWEGIYTDANIVGLAIDEIKRLREEVEIWKDRCAAERADHEATIKHADKMLED